MKKIFLLNILVILFAFVKPVFADAADDLSQLLSPINTLQSNFSQSVYDNRGKPIQRSYGRMAVKRPGKFRWEVMKPNPQVIIANGSRIWVYDADLQQVTVRAFKQGPGETPALLLSGGAVQLGNDYRVTKMPSKSTRWQWYSLTPRNSDNMYARVQMGFMNNQIRQMHLQDHLGHVTAIQFLNPRYNSPLAASQFVFRAPRNVDVIDDARRQR